MDHRRLERPGQLGGRRTARRCLMPGVDGPNPGSALTRCPQPEEEQHATEDPEEEADQSQDRSRDAVAGRRPAGSHEVTRMTRQPANDHIQQ